MRVPQPAHTASPRQIVAVGLASSGYELRTYEAAGSHEWQLWVGEPINRRISIAEWVRTYRTVLVEMGYEAAAEAGESPGGIATVAREYREDTVKVQRASNRRTRTAKGTPRPSGANHA